MPKPMSIFGTVIALSACLSALAQDAPALQQWTYHTDAYYLSDQYADPGGRLNDGQVGAGADKVIYRASPLVMQISLAEPAEVTRVVAHVHRHNANYTLTDFRARALAGGHFEEMGSVPGFFGEVAQKDFELAIDVAPTTTQRLQLVFSAGSIISISEIEVFGNAAAGAGTVQSDLPFADVDRPTVSEKDLDGDGTAEIILENSKVGMVFYPALGGVCKVLYDKRSETDLAYDAGGDMGVLRDQLWDPKYFFSKRFYFAETGSDDTSAWVKLSATGEGGILSFMQMTKRISLGQGSEIITADYELANDPTMNWRTTLPRRRTTSSVCGGTASWACMGPPILTTCRPWVGWRKSHTRWA